MGVVSSIATHTLSNDQLIEERKEILDIEMFLNEYEEKIEAIKKEKNINDFTKDYRNIKFFLLSNDYDKVVHKGNDLLVNLKVVDSVKESLYGIEYGKKSIKK